MFHLLQRALTDRVDVALYVLREKFTVQIQLVIDYMHQENFGELQPKIFESSLI